MTADWRGDSQRFGFDSLAVARVVHERRVTDDAALEHAERETLQPRPPVLHAPLVQCAERPDDVRHAEAVRPEGGGKAGEREEGMNVQQVEVGHVLRQPGAERPRERIESRLPRKIPVGHAVLDDRHSRHGASAGSVVVGSCHVCVDA